MNFIGEISFDCEHGFASNIVANLCIRTCNVGVVNK